MVRISVNGKENRVTDVNQFFSVALKLVGIHRPVTLQVLKDRIEVVFDLAIEFCDMSREPSMKGSEKAQLTRMKNKITYNRIYWRRITSKAIFIKRYFDFVLSMEGLNYLPSFGFSNRFGDKLSGDAERVSVTDGVTLLKG